MSSAGCPGSLRGSPCPSLIQNGPGFPPAVTPTPGAWCPTYLPGVPAAQASSFDQAAAAAAVGGFLGALHVPAPADAPANPFRGVPLAERAGKFMACLALLTGQAGQDHVDRDAGVHADRRDAR